MILLNPIWLLLSPLVLVPLLIHLWNQRRHKVVDWGAMKFLLAAQQMRGGRQRLRHWLIMLCRMLAIAGLIFLLSRPLASGLLGMISGGQPQTVLVLLDRSASMQQQTTLGGESKLQIGLRTIAATLEETSRKSKIYLFDACQSSRTVEPISGNSQVTLLERPADLLDTPSAAVTDAQSDFPRTLEAAYEFVRSNQTGRTDVWLCSDSAQNDWQADDPRWDAIRKQFAELKGVRFHFLQLPQTCPENLAIQVGRCEVSMTDNRSELLLSLTLRRMGTTAFAPLEVPVTLVVGNSRQTIPIEISSDEAILDQHRIQLPDNTDRGWGYVEIANDCRPADNRYYFTFAPSTAQQTVIVAEQPEVTRPLELAAGVPLDPKLQSKVLTITPAQFESIDLSQTQLLVWQATLPSGLVAQKLEQFLRSGRNLVCLPPRVVDTASFAGVRWETWQNTDEGERINQWDNEHDLWRRSGDGQALPLDKLRISQFCNSSGTESTIARMTNDVPLLSKKVVGRGKLYMLATLPMGSYSNLDKQLVAIYVLVQRAIKDSENAFIQSPSKVAGSLDAYPAAGMEVLATNPRPEGAPLLPSTARPLTSGVYQERETLLAINRPEQEDLSGSLDDQTIKELFAGLDLNLISGSSEQSSLANEIWKSLAVLMVIALLSEAALTMPPVQPVISNSGFAARKVAA